MMIISCDPTTKEFSHTPAMPRAQGTPKKGAHEPAPMTSTATTHTPPTSPMGPPRPLPTPPGTRSVSRPTGSPSPVSSSSETTDQYRNDLSGTYSCEVIEPGTAGTEVITMRKETNIEPSTEGTEVTTMGKETNNQLQNDAEVEIDVVSTPRQDKTEEYIEPSMPENFYHNVELLHGNPPCKDPPKSSACSLVDEIEKETIEEIDLTKNDEKERPNKRKFSNRAQENSHRAREALLELDRLMKQEYEIIKGREGSPEDIAKNAILRYVDSAVEKVLSRMSMDEKKTYWNNIADSIVTDNETRNYSRRTMIQKLAEHVTIREPANKTTKQESKQPKGKKAENSASTSKETGTIVTLPKRNQLHEFHQHMIQLNKEREQTEIRLEGERKAIAALMRVPRRAHVEIRNGMHTLVFHCDGCHMEMLAGMHCPECTDFDLCTTCYKKNGHRHHMECFSSSQQAPGQNVQANPIRKELQAASVVSPVLSQTGEPFIEQLSTYGTTVRQQVKITIDRQNRMQITGILPGQELYKYNDGSLKIHWNYDALRRAHEVHYLNHFNCLQLSSLAGYLSSQAGLQQDAATKEDLERRIKAITVEINKRYSDANEITKNR